MDKNQLNKIKEQITNLFLQATADTLGWTIEKVAGVTLQHWDDMTVKNYITENLVDPGINTIIDTLQEEFGESEDQDE